MELVEVEDGDEDSSNREQIEEDPGDEVTDEITVDVPSSNQVSQVQGGEKTAQKVHYCQVPDQGDGHLVNCDSVVLDRGHEDGRVAKYSQEGGKERPADGENASWRRVRSV